MNLQYFLLTMLFPLPLCVGFGLLGYCLWDFSRFKKTGRGLVLLAFLSMLLFGSQLFSNALVRPLEQNSTPIAHRTEDMPKTIVVLGGGYQLVSGRQPAAQMSVDTLLRLLEGIRLAQEINESRLVLSLGAPDTQNLTVDFTKQFGLAPSQVFIEDQARNTAEQAAALAPFVGDKPFLLVSTASHLPRALSICRANGLNPVPAPSHWYSSAGDGSIVKSLVPSAYGLLRTRRAIYEYLGITWWRLSTHHT